MRGEASRIADRVSRDSLAPKLRDSGEDAWRIGNELFTITSALDHNIQLERALTDPSRPVEDKVAVVKTNILYTCLFSFSLILPSFHLPLL